jgi:hypothetical protein
MMRQGKKPKAVSFDAADEFELVRGIILPAGRYDGWERSSASSTMQAGRKSPPRYDLAFSAEQLRDLGAFGARDEPEASFDVTQQVREGMLVLI